MLVTRLKYNKGMFRPLLFLLSISLFCIGCMHYPKSVDNSYYSEIKKTKYTASLNFYSESSRIDDSKSAKIIVEEFRKSGIFISENFLYDDYEAPNNLVVDCLLKNERKGLFGAEASRANSLAVLVPLPLYSEAFLECSVYDKVGLRQTYKSNLEYSTYPFILFVPIGLVHYFIYAKYPEKNLAQDILKQMNADQFKKIL